MSTRTSPHDVLRHLDFGEQPRRRFRRPSIWHQRSCRIANNPFSHSGGEEVLLDVAGQDSTEAFEDVGHSDEARETLEQLYVGDLKRQVRKHLKTLRDTQHAIGVAFRSIVLTNSPTARRPRAQQALLRCHHLLQQVEQRQHRLRHRPVRHPPHRRSRRLRRMAVPAAAADCLDDLHLRDCFYDRHGA